MGIGSVNLASTPCCGLISRSYECYLTETGWSHNPGGNYAPEVEDFYPESNQLASAICPDCDKSFARLLQEVPQAKGRIVNTRWEWDFQWAQTVYDHQQALRRRK